MIAKYESRIISNDDIRVYIRPRKYIRSGENVQCIEIQHIPSGLFGYGEDMVQTVAYNIALKEIENYILFYMAQFYVELDIAIKELKEMNNISSLERERIWK